MNAHQDRRPRKARGLAAWTIAMALSLCVMALSVVGLSGCQDNKPASSTASNDSQVTQPTDTGVVSSGEVNQTGPVAQNTTTAAPDTTTTTATTTATATKSNDELAQEVIRGDWGNGQDRVDALTNAGYDAGEVQQHVNGIMSANTSTAAGTTTATTTTTVTATKSTNELALEVISGKWGNGQDRIDALTNAGYDAGEVQQQVNEIIYSDPDTYGGADDGSDDVSDGSQVTWHDLITEDVYEDVPVYATKYCYTYSATACHGTAITPPIAATSGYDYDNDADAMATGNTEALTAIRAAGYDAQTLADCDCTVTTASTSVQTGTEHVKTGTRVVQEEGWY